MTGLPYELLDPPPLQRIHSSLVVCRHRGLSGPPSPLCSPGSHVHMGAQRDNGPPPVIRFDIAEPIPKERPRVAPAVWKESGAELVQVRKARGYTPKSTKVFEEKVAWESRAAIRRCLGTAKPLEGRVAVTITFSMEDQRGDIDNYAKAILDGMNKIIYLDDKQVKELHCYINDSGAPKASVMVTTCQDEG